MAATDGPQGDVSSASPPTDGPAAATVMAVNGPPGDCGSAYGGFPHGNMPPGQDTLPRANGQLQLYSWGFGGACGWTMIESVSSQLQDNMASGHVQLDMHLSTASAAPDTSNIRAAPVQLRAAC